MIGPAAVHFHLDDVNPSGGLEHVTPTSEAMIRAFLDHLPGSSDNETDARTIPTWSRAMPSPFPGMDPYLESPDWFP